MTELVIPIILIAAIPLIVLGLAALDARAKERHAKRQLDWGGD